MGRRRTALCTVLAFMFGLYVWNPLKLRGKPSVEPLTGKDADRPAPVAVSCLGGFGNWTPCSVSCGRGIQFRFYAVETRAQFGGAPCLFANGHTESQFCVGEKGACPGGPTCKEFPFCGLTKALKPNAEAIPCSGPQCSADECCEDDLSWNMPRRARPVGPNGKLLRFGLLAVNINNRPLPSEVSAAVHSKRCYCEFHGYDFEYYTGPQDHGREPHWTRLHLLEKLLPKYDWIFYMDLDTMIVNASLLFEDFVLSRWVTPDTNLLFSEGDHINSGGFFIRNSNWSIEFLKQWWTYGERNIVPFQQSQDQGPLMVLVLDRLNKERNGGYDGSCHGNPDEGLTWKCFNRWMLRMGLHPNERFTKHMVWYPCNMSTIRGFNFYGQMAHYWVQCQTYIGGDFMSHSRQPFEYDIGFTESFCPNPWASYLHVEVGLQERDGVNINEFNQQMRDRSADGTLFRIVSNLHMDHRPSLFILLNRNTPDPGAVLRISDPLRIDGRDRRLEIIQTWVLHWDGKGPRRKEVARPTHPDQRTWHDGGGNCQRDLPLCYGR